jgi:ATP-dependent DNA helicase RecG
MEKESDGFKISEEDFKLRGHGDLFGTKQSGDMSFKIASLKDDYDLLIKAKEDSEEYLLDEECKDELKENFIKSMNVNY